MQDCNKSMQISWISQGLNPHFRIPVVLQLKVVLLHWPKEEASLILHLSLAPVKENSIALDWTCFGSVGFRGTRLCAPWLMHSSLCASHCAGLSTLRVSFGSKLPHWFTYAERVAVLWFNPSQQTYNEQCFSQTCYNSCDHLKSDLQYHRLGNIIMVAKDNK